MTRLFLLVAFSLMASTASAQSLPKWAEPGAGPSAEGPMADAMPPCPPGQVEDPPGSGNCVGDPPPQVPIDGGLGLLALAGGAYAAKRLRRRRDGEPDGDA